MINEISRKKLYTNQAENFIQEIARQAILNDESMMAREMGYDGFGMAPVLSESLFRIGLFFNLTNLCKNFDLIADILSRLIYQG